MPIKGLLVSLLCLLFMATAVSSEPTPERCLAYETDGVKLTGRIKIRTFPGPPNFESVKKGDTPEVAWVLHLAKPICVKADQENEFDVAENNVTDVQLALDSEHKEWRALARSHALVTVTGKLFHSHTGHHHTAVLMEVAGMKREG
jgi:Domain of unknown function (DUF4431)